MFIVGNLGWNRHIADLIGCVGRALLVGMCGGFSCGLVWLGGVGTFSQGVDGVVVLEMFYVLTPSIKHIIPLLTMFSWFFYLTRILGKIIKYSRSNINVYSLLSHE